MKTLTIVFSLLLGVSFSLVTQAKTLKLDPDELSQRTTQAFSEATFKRVERARAYASGEDYNSAISILTRLLDNVKPRPYEYAKVLEQLGYTYAQAGKPKLAVEQLQKALLVDVLPLRPTLNLLFSLAQMNMNLENYSQALMFGRLFLKIAKDPKAETYILIASAYAEQQKKKLSLKYVQKAIQRAQELKQQPKEGWLKFALALNMELERFEEAKELLLILTRNHPNNKQYWKQLTGVYLSLEKPFLALSSLEIANKLGHITEETETLTLVSLFMDQGIPLRGAQLLQSAIDKKQLPASKKNLEILSSAYMLAEELNESIEVLGEAAKLAKDGKLDARRGQLFIQQENWDQAVSALSTALKKGQLKDQDKVYFALGVAKFNQGEAYQAINHLKTAKRFTKNTKNIDQWIAHIESDLQTKINLEL